MVRKTSVALTLAVTGLLAVASAAQTPAPADQAQAPAAPPVLKAGDLRHQIFVMEGALIRAVQYGAQQYNRQLSQMSREMAMLAGDAEARGVYLEGYGVLFHVGVPVMRQSMMWSLRTIYEQDDETLKEALAFFKQLRDSVPVRDLGQRRTMEGLIAKLELQVAMNQRGGMIQPPRGGQDPGRSVGAAMVSPDAPTPPAPQAQAPPPGPTAQERQMLQDPIRIYTEAVLRAITEAMIDYAQPMLIGAEEWLTVAARDNEPRDSFAPQDPLEEVVTFLLRIKGGDLAAYRAGRIDREEAMKRVQIREF